MNLRIKLLLGFSLLALSALTFFGFIAYETAIQTSTEKEAALLKQVFAQSLSEMTVKLQNNEDVTPLINKISEQQKHTSMVVQDKQGTTLFKTENIESYQAVKSMAEKNNNGQHINELHSYTWTKFEIPDTEYTVTLVFDTKQAPQLSFLRQMGLSLTFTAFIVLWIAAWAAMYIATLVEKLNEQRRILQHQALHDNLTGLPNRVYLHDQLSLALEKNKETNFALCFIDLNSFKEVNDTLGHHCGDELLAIVSRRLQRTVRGSDTVSRLGGDEFAILLHNTDAKGAEAVAKNIVTAIEEAITLDEQNCFVSCSIGIANYPEHGLNSDELLRNADAAMYSAKKNGIRYLFYKPEHNDTSNNKLGITSELRDAINNREIQVYYQAKFDITEKRITGAEALARWNHPQRGFIPPIEFIEIAEQTGLITPLSFLVIEKSFRDQKQLEKNGHDLSIAVNLSNCNLNKPGFVEKVIELVKQYKVNPRKFILELTESAVMSHPDQVKATLTALADLGFIISIDDFGTGYSSLINLKRLPVDEIKIDRSFVFNLFNNEEDASIVRTTIALGRSLGINVVAEGVENKEILDLIGVFGCNQAQGYFISKPIPFIEFNTWLSTQKEFLLPGDSGKAAL